MNFDEAARTWDGEERRVLRAKAVAERLVPVLEPFRGKNALDFGCGTGLLSFFLRDFFARIDLLDPSEGMIEVLLKKIEADDDRRRSSGAAPGAAMRPFRGTLESMSSSLGPYDAIFSMLVLHHIRDTEGTLRGLRSVLAPGGLLALVDLDAEDGSYHLEYDDFSGYNGFDRGALSDVAERAGFAKPSFRTIYVERRDRGEGLREYPLFVMAAGAAE
jgi:SAM-dependent methyltransferase